MELLGLLLALGLIVALILPWVNMTRINGQRSELDRLKREVWKLQNQRDAAVQAAVVPTKKPEPTKEAMPREAPVVVAKVEQSPGSIYTEVSASDPVDLGNAVPNEVLPEAKPADPKDWFSKIAVWVGGIALLMAGFYMIKYSIDSGWLSPAVRIWLTTGFGALLCGAGFVVGIQSAMVANGRIGQALSGAGIACLYFAAYAAVHLYSFLSPTQGFVAMLVVTVLAVALSLKNGAPVAMMGLVGGFLTPWLMSTGSNDTVMLFSYLFLLFCGAQFLCVRRGWWALFSLLSVGALVLAVLKEDDFIWAAWLALTAVAASALSNTDSALWSWLAAPLGLMGLFFVVGHWRGLSSERALTWRSLSVAAALLVVPILYLNREFMVGLDVSVNSSVWIWLAAIWAGLLVLAGEHLFRREGNSYGSSFSISATWVRRVRAFS